MTAACRLGAEPLAWMEAGEKTCCDRATDMLFSDAGALRDLFFLSGAKRFRLIED
jgi:hypothetical protein